MSIKGQHSIAILSRAPHTHTLTEPGHYRDPYSPAAAAAAGLLCAAGGFMSGLGPACVTEGPARCWPRDRVKARAEAGMLRLGFPLPPACSHPASRLPRAALHRAPPSTVRTPKPGCLIAAGGGGAGRGRGDRPSRCPGDVPVPQAPPSPRACRGTAVTRSGRSPGYSPKYLCAALPAP